MDMSGVSESSRMSFASPLHSAYGRPMQQDLGPTGAVGPAKPQTAPPPTPTPASLPTPTPSAPPGQSGSSGEPHPSSLDPFTEFAQQLAVYPGGGDPNTEDGLFQIHTNLVGKILAGLVPSESAVVLWEKMQPLAEAAEARIAQKIHKGAPFYNTGLCLFVCGDFDGAYYFINRAAREDERIGRMTFPGILIGDHALSKQIILDPLVLELIPIWQKDYLDSTGIVLDEAELRGILRWLAQRPSDAFTVVAALHRVRRSLKREGNEAVRLVVVRAMADILVCLESSLRHKQGAGNHVGEQLGKRLPPELALNPAASAAFTDLHDWWVHSYIKAQRESEIGVNGLIVEGSNRFAAAVTVAQRMGIILCTAYRLRNSVLHVNEEGLGIYQDRNLGLRMAGWAFAACRLVKHMADLTFAAIP